MRTPNDWIKSKTRLVNTNVVTGHFKEADIKAIQADAVKHRDNEVKELRKRVQELEDAIGNLYGYAKEMYETI